MTISTAIQNPGLDVTDPTHKAVFPLQILCCEFLAVQILQRKWTANLRLPNTLAHLGNPLPLQTRFFNPEVHHHARAREHEE